MVFSENKAVISKSNHSICQGTIFCDLDGTLVKHENNPNYDSDLILLPSTNDKLQHWMDIGYRIIICTARISKDEVKLRKSLERAGIPYHELIMGLPSGPRYVINDRKPSGLLVSQALSREVSRDMGIQNITLSLAPLRVMKIFDGASLADTLLVKNKDRLFIRKKVLKGYGDNAGYLKLKNQYKVIEKFNELSPDITPKMFGDGEDSMEYYYDMEYLSSYSLLSECSERDKINGISILLQKMGDEIYTLDTVNSLNNTDWLIRHLDNKIYTKFSLLKDDAQLNMLIDSDEISIDGRIYQGLKGTLSYIINSELAQVFSPKSICTVHGDLTLENVFFDKIKSIKIIDMEGADFFDARELDFGKMMQSIIAKYESWAHSKEVLIESFNLKNQSIKTKYKLPDPDVELLDVMLDKWSKILNISKLEAHKIGLFYLSLHLIRMTPYRLRVGKDQAIFALLNAVKYMNKSINITE